MINRRYASIRFVASDGYSGPRQEIMFTDKKFANVVTSMVQDNPPLHAPCLDFDLPCRLMESKTPGHYHFYIDHVMPWREYKRLLKALWKAGIIEKGWYEGAIKDGMSVVRFAEETMPIDSIIQDLDRTIENGT